jgi:hypothetical protein
MGFTRCVRSLIFLFPHTTNCCFIHFHCRLIQLTESQLTRKAPSSYADGVYMMAGEDRPSPRYLSQVVMKGEDGQPSNRNLTTIFAFFGQYFRISPSHICCCFDCVRISCLNVLSSICHCFPTNDCFDVLFLLFQVKWSHPRS